MMLLIVALLSIAVAQNSPPVAGTAQLTVDLTGLSNDVQVSIDNRDVYRSQGGQIQRYTVRTTNQNRAYQVIITEGAAATVVRSIELANGDDKALRNFRALLDIHLEDYEVPAGNTYAVKLRVRVGGADNIFREYSNQAGAPYRLPLSSLGPIPTSSQYQVSVLAVNSDVTVWAGEYYQGNLAVSVVGHDGNGLVTDADCEDGRCDSGRLVARATAVLDCAHEHDIALPTTDVLTLLSNPSPTVGPVETVRRWTNVAPTSFTWYVLAADNYQVKAEVGAVDKVAAMNCRIGECEAFPLTSVFTIWTSSLRGRVRLSVDNEGNQVNFGNQFDLMDEINGVSAERTRVCVYNLPRYSVRANIATGGVVSQRFFNCGDVDQKCKTYIYADLKPEYGCLPTSDVELAIRVRSGSTSVFEAWGIAPATIVVPAISPLTVELYDGLSQWTPEGHFSDVVTSNVFAEFETTSCLATIDETTRHQDGNAPGECETIGQVDRMLAIFDLAFLPSREAGFQGDGSLPAKGDENNITVTLTNVEGHAFRFVPNQGGAPRMYCVLPVEIRSKIAEGCACYNSEVVSCVKQAAEGADCSVCDFLSILEYDLTGLPRETNSIISAGPRDGKPVVIVDEKFERFSVPARPLCEARVDGSGSPVSWENRYPADHEIEVWGQGCNGAPTAFPSGEATGNTLKVGNMEPYFDGKAEPLPFENTTCVKFTVPNGVTQVNIAFMAWQVGNGNDDNNAFVRARGVTSGQSLKGWIQVTPNAWTRNHVRLLNVKEGEQAEVCFVQSGIHTTLVDNIKIDGQQFELCPIRWMYWQGNYFNQIPVLRTGSGEGCPAGEFGRYCVTVYDGDAYKQQCVTCDDKTCQPFERFVCNMCLDLASPNDTPGLENAITVSLNVGGSSFRTIPGQGGTNGCIRNTKDVSKAQKAFAELEHRKELARGLTSEVMTRLELAEVEKQRREILAEIATEYKARQAESARSGPYTDPGQQQSIYPVLCLKYRVCVSEGCVGPVCFDVDCSETGTDADGTCSYQEIVALATIPFDCPNLPGNLGLTLYSPGASFDYATGQLQAGTGCQVRGETGRMLLNQDTCVWSPPKFVGPSYADVGNQPFSFPVLRTSYQVRLDENTVGFTYGSVQPDPLQHPYSTAQLECTGRDECEVTTGSLVSEWYIRSERGLPQAPDARLGIKFGDNSQNLVRSIPAGELQAPDWNRVCVLSDNRPWYVALWETWSSRGPNLPFDNCSSNTTTIDECNNRVVVPPRTK